MGHTTTESTAQQSPIDPDRIGAFLAGHFAALRPGETINIRPIHATSGRRFPQGFAPSVAAALAYIATVPPDFELYFGVNPRQGDDGTKAGVSRIFCLHADVDDKYFGNDRDASKAAIADFDLPPTVLVRSGNGWHCYWHLDTPLDAREWGARAELAMRRLFLALGGIDAVQDLSRILRVAGTMHRKDPQHPKPVEVYTASGPTYTLAEIEAVLPALPPAEVAYREVTAVLGDDERPDKETIRHLLSFIDAATTPYEDYYLIWAAVAYYYPDADGEALIAEWSDEARAHLRSSPAKQPNKHRGFRRQTGRVATLGTLIHYAKLGGYEPPRRPLNLVTIGRRRRGQSFEDRLAELPDPDPAELPHFLKGVYEHLGSLVEPFPRDLITLAALTFFSQCWPGIKFENLNLALWLNIVMESGSGKNVVTDALYDITKRLAGVTPTLFTSGSPEGVFAELSRDGGHNRQLFAYLGEFGEFLSSLTKEYMRSARGTYCNLYDGRAVSHILSKGTMRITDPYMTMVGTTTPTAFREYVTEQDLNGGFASRFLYCAPVWANEGRRDTPSVAAEVEFAALLDEQIAATAKARLARFDCPPGTVPAAYAALEQLYGVGNGERRTIDDALASPLTPKGRHLARVKKIAALLELLDLRPQIEGEWLVVQQRWLDLAIVLVRRSEVYQDWVLSTVAKSADTKMMEKIERVLRKRPQGMSRADLLKFAHLDALNLTRLLPVLADDGLIEEGRDGHGKLLYRIVGLSRQLDQAHRHQDAAD